MSKLLKLKEWLTVCEAARHLSILFGEPVSESDVLRLGLDEKLKLSVYFVNHAQAEKQKIVRWEDAERVPSIDGERMIVLGDYWDEEHVLVPAHDGDGATTIRGVFDLTMRGAERLDIEHQYQLLTNGPAVTLICLDGPLVQAENGTYWGLRDSFEPREVAYPNGIKKQLPRSYYPAAGLPDDGVIVVRTSALQELCSRLHDESTKLLATTERNTLLKLVIGMAVRGYGYDSKAARSAIPKQIADDLACIGINVSDDTVRKYLAEAKSSVLPDKVP